MPTAFLDDRALIAITGADAEHLLQNVITTDLDALKTGEAKPGALLSPQGKILFDFLVSRAPEGGLLLECRAAVADDFVRRLMLYRLRAKATISRLEPIFVRISWQTDSAASGGDTGLIDLRFATSAQVRRTYVGAPDGDNDLVAWQAFRIAHGVPESGQDYALGDAFPHDVLLDQTDGIGFRKGCYVGQEVVSRMQHRGTARRRALIGSADTALPESGTELTAGGRGIGTLGSVSGTSGIAMVRIDRVKDAIDAGTPIMAGGVPISLSIPAWVNFGFPQDGAAPEQA